MIHEPARDAEPVSAERPIELSVVMPCLNEADTLEACIAKAQAALRAENISGEIIVADNGSRDGSPEIAARHGARVVPVSVRGYGSALMAGIAAARGRYVLLDGSDDDVGETPCFVEGLVQSYWFECAIHHEEFDFQS